MLQRVDYYPRPNSHLSARETMCSSPVVLNCMIASQVQRIIGAPYALPAPHGMAGRFEPLLDGNREQRPSETEFVAIGVN